MELLGVALEATLFLLLLTVPGVGILLALADTVEDPGLAMVYGVAMSLCYDVFVGLLLLRAGVFSYAAVAALALVPLAVAFLQRGVADIREQFVAWSRRLSSTLLPASLAVLVLVAAIVTPRWTFLIGTGLDAGNYEIYGNHFWLDGSLYLDVGGLLENGVPPRWIEFRNTWFFDRPDVGRPAYLYAYPVMLGITKAGFGSVGASWVLNAVLGALTVFALAILARAFARSSHRAIVAVVPAVATPAFFFYTKHIMSEMLALFALTVVLICITDEHEERASRRGVPLVAGSAMALALLTKVDVIVPAVLICLGVLFVGSVGRSGRVPPRTATALGVGFLFAAILNSWLVAPRYLDKVSPSEYLEQVRQTSLAGAGMYILVALVLLVALTLVGRREPELPAAGHGIHQRTLDGAFWVFAAGWALFAGWNLWIRPAHGSLATDHDPLNLVRLLDTYSPFVIAMLVAGVPLLSRERNLRRWVPAGLIVALAMVILESNHSRTEVWWMRRYLVMILPAAAVVGGQAFHWVARREGRSGRVAVALLASGALIAAAVQVANMRPLFAHEVNSESASRLAAITDVVPEQTPLVVVGDEPHVNGLGNTLRSVRDGPTLIAVPVNELPKVMELFHGGYTVLSPAPLAERTTGPVDLSMVAQGEYVVQWQSWLGEIAEDPVRRSLFPYYLYRHQPPS